MKSKTSPAAIGMFITGAIVIIVLSVVLFSSGRFFRQTKPYLLTFRESVTGLNPGAPVRILGVSVGEVKDIWLGFDTNANSPMINVRIEVDRQQMAGEFKAFRIDLDDRSRFDYLVKVLGLAARLETASLLSGQLSIAVEPYPGQASFQLHREPEHGLWEIPTIPSAQRELRESLKTTVQNLGQVDLGGISDQLKGLLTDLRTDLAAIEFGKLNGQLVSSLNGVDGLLKDAHLKSALTNLDVTLSNAGDFMSKLNRETNPLLGDVRQDLQKAGDALDEATRALAALKAQVQPGSTLLRELVETLQRASRALDAVTQLADDLRRNPNSLITGKSPTKP